MKNKRINTTLKLSMIALGTVGAISYSLFKLAIAPTAHRKDKVENELGNDKQRKIAQNNRDLDWYFKQEVEEYNIISFDGLKLTSKMIKAKNDTDKTVIAIHGYQSNGLKEYISFIKFYHDMGFNVLLPDNRAHGKSEGKYIGFGWLDRLDCKKWIQLIIDHYGPTHKIVLHGISMGAATVLMTSGEDVSSQVKVIIADCGYTSAWDEFAHQLTYYKKLPTFPLLNIANYISQVIAKYNFKDASAIKQVKKSKIPTLFIHGDKDEFVPTKMVYELYDACNAPKDLLIIEGAGHALCHVYDEEKYDKKVKEFVELYIDN